MKGWHMYSQIQSMKEAGFSIRQVARTIRVSRNTISKYWEMTAEEYSKTYKAINRMTALMAYKPVILKWLEAFPSMTAAQVRDWLEENYKLDAAERSVRRLVANLREQHGISKKAEPKRDYEAVEELPMGYQLQLDFGVKTARYAYSSRYVKLYLAIFTLTYSRYKWGYFQERPFLSSDLVQALYSCFEYFGGMPHQLVYDQDCIIVVSENNGDIIHTQAFEAFLAETKLQVRVCRKSDPETKGVIEASVKFVKGNFMENRLFMDIDIWNQSFEDWLIRTGNRKEHGTTKRRPEDMFVEEQEHLLPLFGVAPIEIEEDMERKVRKDNTILFLSNRYSLPLGTYNKHKVVFLVIEDNKLNIMDQIGEPLAKHQLNTGKGKLVKLESHRLDKSARIKELLDKTVSLLGEEFREYLAIMCDGKPRYAKEQLTVVVQSCEVYGRECVLEAMHYCRNLALFSANDLNDAAKMISGNFGMQPPPQRLLFDDERYHIPVQQRSLSVYSEVAKGSGVAQ